MHASLIESPDEHHWVLLDHRITQLVIDTSSVRLQSWALDGSLEIRLSAPFTLRSGGGSGSARLLDPTDPPALAPMLALLHRPLRAMTIARRGDLTLELGGGTVLVASRDARADAWEVQGAGALEGVVYSSALVDSSSGPGARP